MSNLEWDTDFSTMSLEQQARQISLNLPEEWKELIAFLIEHWGCFACTIAELPTISDQKVALARRRLELNGSIV